MPRRNLGKIANAQIRTVCRVHANRDHGGAALLAISGVTPIFKLLLCAQTNKRWVFGLFVSNSASGFRHAIRTAVPLFPLVIE